jgi:hypothetical protein
MNFAIKKKYLDLKKVFCEFLKTLTPLEGNSSLLLLFLIDSG